MPFSKEEIRRFNQQWPHVENGVRVFQPEGGEFGSLTIKVFPNASIETFRQLSSASWENEDYDLLCDEHRDGDLVETIPIRRQDLAVIERAIGVTP